MGLRYVGWSQRCFCCWGAAAMKTKFVLCVLMGNTGAIWVSFLGGRWPLLCREVVSWALQRWDSCRNVLLSPIISTDVLWSLCLCPYSAKKVALVDGPGLGWFWRSNLLQWLKCCRCGCLAERKLLPYDSAVAALAFFCCLKTKATEIKEIPNSEVSGLQIFEGREEKHCWEKASASLVCYIFGPLGTCGPPWLCSEQRRFPWKHHL